jgi:hypothetical protein
MEATCSSEIRLTFTKLHDVLSQRIELLFCIKPVALQVGLGRQVLGRILLSSTVSVLVVEGKVVPVLN